VRVAKTATPVGDVRKRLTASPAVEFVEPVPNRWPAEADPQLNRQWGLRAIRWFNVARPDAAKVHVAVLDSGIDASHPDLKGTIETYDHAGNSARDYCGHGTHVAGTIAAIVNNGIGVAGVANCRLHCWKIFDDRKPNPLGGVGPFNFEYYVDALASLLDAKPPIKVVNLSIGGTASSNTEATLYRELRAAGILVVAAMGNEYLEGNPTSYPAAYDGVLAVGACDEVDRRGEFSNTGQHIQISAPGVNVLSTVPTAKSIFGKTTDYDSWDGTSMATPHVAGCAALVYAANGGALDAKAIEKLLTKRARKVPEMKGKVFTPEFGFGVVSLNGVLSNKGKKGAKPKKPGKPKKKSKAKAKGD
jgi:subtilisin family serine protease